MYNSSRTSVCSNKLPTYTSKYKLKTLTFCGICLVFVNITALFTAFISQKCYEYVMY